MTREADMNASEGELSRERRLDEIITAYLKEVDHGRGPDEAEWLMRHPDLAAELAAFFAAQKHVDRLASPLRQVAPLSADDAPTIGPNELPVSGTRIGYFGDYELLEEV